MEIAVARPLAPDASRPGDLPLSVKPDIKSFSREELVKQFEAWNEPDYRLTQLLDWLYLKRVATWEAMSNMPKALRERLKEGYQLAFLEMVRKQGTRDETQKFLWRLPDNAFIESVLIPANPALYSEASDRSAWPATCTATAATRWSGPDPATSPIASSPRSPSISSA